VNSQLPARSCSAVVAKSCAFLAAEYQPKHLLCAAPTRRRRQVL